MIEASFTLFSISICLNLGYSAFDNAIERASFAVLFFWILYLGLIIIEAITIMLNHNEKFLFPLYKFYYLVWDLKS
jgi:hypothetical protein